MHLVLPITAQASPTQSCSRKKSTRPAQARAHATPGKGFKRHHTLVLEGIIEHHKGWTNVSFSFSSFLANTACVRIHRASIHRARAHASAWKGKERTGKRVVSGLDLLGAEDAEVLLPVLGLLVERGRVLQQHDQAVEPALEERHVPAGRGGAGPRTWMTLVRALRIAHCALRPLVDRHGARRGDWTKTLNCTTLCGAVLAVRWSQWFPGFTKTDHT